MASYSPIGMQHPIGEVTGKVPTSVNITTVSTQILAANDERRFVSLSNIGNQDVFIAVGQTALSEKGLVLAKGETIFVGLRSESPKEAINGIVKAGSTDIAILEFE